MATNFKSSGGGTASDSAVISGVIARSGRVAAPAILPSGPLPLRRGDVPLRELVDLYFAQYSGRDVALVQRLSWWSGRLGELTLAELSDDEVHTCLEHLASQRSRYFAGFDAGGAQIYKARKNPMSAATVNRYLAALSAVISWAIKKRIAPKGYVHPCRTVERRSENNERVRFLSDDERTRLLAACADARWDRLHVLVLMAITTGARKGELLSLRWRDIDHERQLAYCGLTKNGDPKALPLVPEVLMRLAALRRGDSSLIFGSTQNPLKPFDFKAVWRKALAAAGIRNFRFHDLRHTCASMLAQNGATLLEIADVLGHRQLQMTKRYSHLTTSHKAALVNRIWRDTHGSSENE